MRQKQRVPTETTFPTTSAPRSFKTLPSRASRVQLPPRGAQGKRYTLNHSRPGSCRLSPVPGRRSVRKGPSPVRCSLDTRFPKLPIFKNFPPPQRGNKRAQTPGSAPAGEMSEAGKALRAGPAASQLPRTRPGGQEPERRVPLLPRRAPAPPAPGRPAALTGSSEARSAGWPPLLPRIPVHPESHLRPPCPGPPPKRAAGEAAAEGGIRRRPRRSRRAATWSLC